MKKKYVSVLLAVTLGCSTMFTGCGSAEKAGNETETTTEAASENGDENASGETTEAFTYEENGQGAIKLTAYSGNSEVLAIPETIDGKKVTEIGESCFAGSLTLKEITFPEGVEKIGDYAFECCSYLHKVYLPESLKSIGNGAFSGCVELTLVDIQNGLETIGDGAFLFCEGLPYVELPETLSSIGNFAFSWCIRLAYADIENTAMTEIPDRAFYHCTALQSMKISDNISKIGLRAFSDCTSLTEIYFPDTVKEISSYAFEGCERLESANMPCEVFEGNVFRGCASLTWINLEDSVKKICANAYAGTGVDFLMLPSTVEEMEPGMLDDTLVYDIMVDEESGFVFEDGILYTADKETVIADITANMEGEGEESAEEENNEEENNEEEYVDESGEEFASGEEVTGEDMTAGENSGEEAASELSGLPALEEVLSKFTEYADYSIIDNDSFDAWTEDYMACNSEIVVPDSIHNIYVSLYKGEVVPHYYGMTSALNHDESMVATAVEAFGEDYLDMYLMMDHGLETEINRFKFPENMVLFTGVYDSQLRAAAGTEETPDLEELKNCIGNTFTDPIIASTTTDPVVATGFSDTMFIIYASKDSLESLGCVCMDAYMHSNENEILLNKNAEYKILDVGTMSVDKTNESGEETTIAENYIIVELCN